VLLMTPGPVAVDQRVIAVMNRPAITPNSRVFMDVLQDVLQKLRTIFCTESWVAVLPGSGRMGLEAAIVSALEHGDRSVHLVNGAFGELMVEIAQRAGAQVTVVEGEWGGPVNLEAVEQAIHRVRPRLVTMVHSETSTGALYSPYEIGSLSHHYGALFMVDAISSLGNMPVQMDAMDADFTVTASNKGLGSLHGLSMVGVSESACQAMDARQTTCHSLSLDLKRWNDMFFSKPSERRIPTPPPTHLIFALQEACRLVLEEGLEARWSRCHRYATATRQGVEAAGLEIFPDQDLLGDCVTAVRVPEGLQSEKILLEMEANGVLIAGTVARPSPISGRLLRISHQGIQASEEMLIPTLAALERTLRSLGYPIDRGVMVTAFEDCLEH
jgi:alanine-glyoxylate transaminase/serine-glyoxylate transaminase/serine-pyruvate transaminase